MSIPYERYDDEIQIEDHERSASESDEEDESDGHNVRLQRTHDLFSNKWPQRSGIIQLVTGFLLTFLGLAEVIIIPLAFDTQGDLKLSSLLKLDRSNSWGLGIWTGVALSMTGSLGLRASVYRSIFTIYAFFIAILLDTILFTGALSLCLFTYDWREAKSEDTWGFAVHICVVLVVCFAFVLIMHSFTIYYEDVFCGELQLCKRSIHCCCPCWCPPPVAQHELLQEESGHERPPSIPI